jgi:enoyl-CoA hydratase/carnithine racemase
MPAPGQDRLIETLAELGGAGLVVREAAATTDDLQPGVVAVGVHRSGLRPVAPSERFDILLTTDPAAGAPWVSLDSIGLDAALSHLKAQLAGQPVAAAVAAQLLRASVTTTFDAALTAESLAYSMLLASEHFRAWRAATPRRERAPIDRPRVLITAEPDLLRLVLDRPERRNAVDARLRDDLCEALDFAAAHPDVPAVVLSGLGPDFCAGGDLEEFGLAADPGKAHLVRLLRSPARRVHGLRDRIEARLHGACIGAGVEIPAAAGRVLAREGARFRLPEVGMGLIPGAGGTATLPRRIGRQRTCYMALSGAAIDLPTALDWGLADGVIP